MYHVFVTYETTRYLCSKNEKQKIKSLPLIDFLLSMCFGVSRCFKTSLAPPAAQLISTLQHIQ